MAAIRRDRPVAAPGRPRRGARERDGPRRFAAGAVGEVTPAGPSGSAQRMLPGMDMLLPPTPPRDLRFLPDWARAFL